MCGSKEFDIMKTLWIISELFPPDETSTAFILGEIANVMAKIDEMRAK